MLKNFELICTFVLISMLSGCLSFNSKPSTVKTECGFSLDLYFDRVLFVDGSLHETYRWIKANMYGGLVVPPNLPANARPRTNGPQFVQMIDRNYFEGKKIKGDRKSRNILWLLGPEHIHSNRYYAIHLQNDLFSIAEITELSHIEQLFPFPKAQRSKGPLHRYNKKLWYCNELSISS